MRSLYTVEHFWVTVNNNIDTPWLYVIIVWFKEINQIQNIQQQTVMLTEQLEPSSFFFLIGNILNFMGL